MVNICAFELHPPPSDHPFPQPQQPEMSSGSHPVSFHLRVTLGAPSAGFPNSRLLKPHPTMLPDRAPLPPFLPEARLHNPGHWSFHFLFIIPSTKTRLRLKQGHPLLITSIVAYLHVICMHSHHLSKCRNGHNPGPFATHSPGEGKVPGLPHSIFLLSDLHPSLRAKDQRTGEAWGKWPANSLTPRHPLGSLYLL